VSKDLNPITINLNVHKDGLITESWLAMFGGAIKYLLQGMFGPEKRSYGALGTIIKGTPSQVASFGDALSKEKRYMETFLNYGLNDPRSFKSKADLNKAVASFERETGIKWPFN
jgi:hypothetical protein